MKLKLIIFSLSLLFTSLQTNGQVPDTLWTKIFSREGSEYAKSIKQTGDGGFIIAGNTHPLLSPNMLWLIKLNEFGDTLWTKVINNNPTQFGTSIQQTIDGGYILLAYADNPDSKIWLIKIDSTGNQIWDKYYGTLEFSWPGEVKQTEDGGYIIVGKDEKLWLIRTNALGDTIWTKKYGNGEGSGLDVLETSDGGFVITGSIKENGTTNAIFMKTDSEGNIIWSVLYDEAPFGRKVIEDVEGNFTFLVGNYSIFHLVKVNNLGEILWERTFSDNYYDLSGNDFVNANYGGYLILVHQSYYGSEINHIQLIGTDSLGIYDWDYVFDFPYFSSS